VLDTVLNGRSPKTASVSKHIDCFQEIGLSLTVLAVNEIGTGTELDLFASEIAELMKSKIV
jgi:hypothetical protein